MALMLAGAGTFGAAMGKGAAPREVFWRLTGGALVLMVGGWMLFAMRYAEAY
jgi:hypothetical protein